MFSVTDSTDDMCSITYCTDMCSIVCAVSQTVLMICEGSQSVLMRCAVSDCGSILGLFRYFVTRYDRKNRFIMKFMTNM
jgi:hypothetical protein